MFSGGITEDNISVFCIEYKKFCELNNIICEFIRFHPLVHNVNYLRNYIEIVDLGDTISLNLDSQELIWNNMTSKNRNVIKKAQKNGVKIYSSKDVSLIDDFMKIDLRVATITAAERVPKTDKLMKLEVRVGEEERTIVSGIAQHYTAED